MDDKTAHHREFRFTQKDFNSLRRIANDNTGIVVSDDKYDMYYSRLVKRIRQLGLQDFSSYVKYLEANRGTELTPFIDSITTNLTSFFREMHHFEYIKSAIVPEFLARPDAASKLRIWSAGCSTGEEPYSIAMTMLETMQDRRFPLPSILATDIDTTVLSTAKQGIYDLARLESLPQSVKKRWFYRGKGKRGGSARVSPELQELVTFRQLNLMEDWPLKNRFHVIFCRNVVIYFDRPTKARLLDRFADLLVDDGYLILGHSESLQGISIRFETVGKTIYRKKG